MACDQIWFKQFSRAGGRDDGQTLGSFITARGTFSHENGKGWGAWDFRAEDELVVAPRDGVCKASAIRFVSGEFLGERKSAGEFLVRDSNREKTSERGEGAREFREVRSAAVGN